jgi:hypothetical protein
MAAKMTNYGSNIAGLNRALRKLPKTAKAELTESSREIAEGVAEDARGRAQALVSRVGGWKYLGPTIKAEKSSKPGIKIGGSRRLKGRGKWPSAGQQTVGNLLWGLEFGGGARPTTRQFLPHLGQEGYALWPAVREHEERTMELYSEGLLRALEKTE